MAYLGAVPVAAAVGGKTLVGSIKSLFGGGPPYRKALDRAKDVVRKASRGDAAALATWKQGAEACTSKYPEVCDYWRRSWYAWQLAQQAGVPFVLRSTGWPDTERIRQAAAAKGVTLDLPEPSPVEAGDTGGGGSWLWIAAAGLGVLFLMRRRK